MVPPLFIPLLIPLLLFFHPTPSIQLQPYQSYHHTHPEPTHLSISISLPTFTSTTPTHQLQKNSLKLHTPPIDFNMGNYSLAYLQQNNLEINCSVYSLSSGSIDILDYYNQTWRNSSDNDNFLPAYYITNCSIPNLINLVIQHEFNETDFENLSVDEQSPYNPRDNGDTFVALLFTLCGSCVSCWMLSLLLYLSPSHKRKPLLTQLTTIFYSIVTTILLNKVTKVAEEEFYNDTLDIIELHRLLYNTNTYKVLMILTQVMTMSAWFQIIMKLSKKRFKLLISWVTLFFMLLYIAIFTFHQIKYNTQNHIHQTRYEPPLLAWSILRSITRVLVVIWLGLNLLWYTIRVKNPLKICYSRKLLPLAIFNWFLLILDVTLNILHISLFRKNWLVKTWLILIPYLIEVILTTTIWEWIFNISILEKRSELMGVLGRRISIEDILDIQSNSDEQKKRKKRIISFKNKSDHKIFGWLINAFGLKANNILQEDDSEEDELKELISSSNNSSTTARQTERSNTNPTNVAQGNSGSTHTLPHHPTIHSFSNNNTPEITTTPDIGSFHHHQQQQQQQDYDDEYIDNYDIWGDDDDDEGENLTNNDHYRHLT